MMIAHGGDLHQPAHVMPYFKATSEQSVAWLEPSMIDSSLIKRFSGLKL